MYNDEIKYNNFFLANVLVILFNINYQIVNQKIIFYSISVIQNEKMGRDFNFKTNR
jgi:hypothetical protein